MARIGVFGGTFNPIHLGHLRAAEEVRERLALGKLLFMPAGVPPLKSRGTMAPAPHRLRMVRLAVKKNPFFEASPIECAASGPSYTVNTMERLKEIYPKDRLYFIAGLDVFGELHLWWRPERLIELVDFVVLSRPGYSFEAVMDSPFVERPKGGLSAKKNPLKLRLKSGRFLYLLRVTDMEISASGIRGLVRAGRSVKYLLPQNVESYIIAHGLYI